MNKYLKLMKERIEKGNLKDGYDLYNQADVEGILPTLPASYGIIGRVGTTLLIEKRNGTNR